MPVILKNDVPFWFFSAFYHFQVLTRINWIRSIIASRSTYLLASNFKYSETSPTRIFSDWYPSGGNFMSVDASEFLSIPFKLVWLTAYKKDWQFLSTT